jgi:hypothetical protein
MRKLVLALATVAAFGIAVPAFTSTPASAETTIIKKSGGHEHGFRHSMNRADKVVIIKKRGHDRYHERRWHHRHMD